MERLKDGQLTETRLTQAEVATLLNRWRDEQENTVSVADVAEALHCSKAEIEALVWRARAEGKHVQKAKAVPISLRTLMFVDLAFAAVFFLLAMMRPGYTES